MLQNIKKIRELWSSAKNPEHRTNHPFYLLFDSSNRKIDLYDCRRRLWYNQAINSPKDVVILMDMSGSMTGAHFKISKLIVQSLLDTLQQDDFFNVLYFNQETGFLIDCLNDTLAQATSYNKNQFKQAVTRLQSPKSVANFPTALKKAFRLINKVGILI